MDSTRRAPAPDVRNSAGRKRIGRELRRYGSRSDEPPMYVGRRASIRNNDAPTKISMRCGISDYVFHMLPSSKRVKAAAVTLPIR